jgi:hypothetical protein
MTLSGKRTEGETISDSVILNVAKWRKNPCDSQGFILDLIRMTDVGYCFCLSQKGCLIRGQTIVSLAFLIVKAGFIVNFQEVELWPK